MKYIHIVQTHLMSGGGVGSVINDLCEAMSKQTNDVFVISLFKRSKADCELSEEWANKHNIQVLFMQRSSKDGYLKVYKRLRKTIKELSKGGECCLFMHLKWGVLGGVVGSLGINNVRRVEVYHSGYHNYKLQATFCKLFINKYIAVSKESQQQLIDWFNISPSKIVVVYNGVDLQYVRSFTSIEKCDDHNLSFLSVGRLTRQKGLLNAIEAFASLKDTGAIMDCTYSIVGKGELMEQAKELSKGYVHFTGQIPREEVYISISSCDVVLFPSLWEGNSIFLLEVLALGKPLIVSDIVSSREVLNFEPLNDSEAFRVENFGIVIRAEDTSSCKQAIIQIINNKHLLNKMAFEVRSLADNFSLNKQVDSYCRVAEEVFHS